MTTAAGSRAGLRFAGFYQLTMAIRAVSVIGFPQGRNLILFPSTVAFRAAELFTFHINKFAAVLVLHMMTDATAFRLQLIGMHIM